jgi:hypothetical protein
VALLLLLRRNSTRHCSQVSVVTRLWEGKPRTPGSVSKKGRNFISSPEDLDQLLPPPPPPPPRLLVPEARYSWTQRLGNYTDHSHLCGAEQIFIRRAIAVFHLLRFMKCCDKLTFSSGGKRVWVLCSDRLPGHLCALGDIWGRIVFNHAKPIF